VKGLALACHPGPTVAVTALTTAVAWSAGRSPAGCLLVAATILTGHLSIGWSNDAIDATRDTIVNRKDKPVVRGLVSRRTLTIGAGVMLVATIPVSLANGTAAGLMHLLFVACAWAYNLGLKSTAISWLPYAVAFGALPSFVTLGTTHTWAPWWATAATALLGVGAHLANVVPDLDDDLATGDAQRAVEGRLAGLVVARERRGTASERAHEHATRVVEDVSGEDELVTRARPRPGEVGLVLHVVMFEVGQRGIGRRGGRQQNRGAHACQNCRPRQFYVLVHAFPQYSVFAESYAFANPRGT